MWSHEAQFEPVALWCRCDVTPLTRRISLVSASPDEPRFWAAGVIFFKVDVSCRPPATLTDRLCGMFTPRELLASQSCHWHLCHRLPPLFGLLNDAARKKKKKSMQRQTDKQSPHSAKTPRCANHASMCADLSGCVYTCAVTVIYLNV